MTRLAEAVRLREQLMPLHDIAIKLGYDNATLTRALIGVLGEARYYEICRECKWRAAQRRVLNRPIKEVLPREPIRLTGTAAAIARWRAP